MEAFTDLPLKFPRTTPGSKHVFHLFVVQLKNQDLRDSLMSHLAAREITTLVHYPVAIHLQPAYNDLGYTEGSLPVTERAVKTILSLPIFPEMEDAEAEYVIENVRNFFKDK